MMGRKPIPAALARSRRVAVMLTEAEYDAFEEAREKLGYATISDMARDALKEMAAGKKRK